MTSLLAKWPILSPGYVVTLAALRFCFSHGTLRLMDRDPEPAERPPKSLVLADHSTGDPERNAFRTLGIGTRELSTTRFGFQDFD